METQNKYYTPDISEFHVGFEFEEHLPSIDEDNEFWEYRKETFTLENSLKHIQESINFEEIRVKHLDQQDIEECGWKNSDETVESIIFSLKGYELSFEKKTCQLEIHNTNIEFSDGEQIFKGIINNKSELKKLMQQLEIN